ncbi:YpoC family protein [Sporosarcina sp. UB5]|uniref:YpoC family protein n=1 Tax=Sporosarcina sp. UB5 TaxID=3047463 RepID=UPI003D7ABF77
MHNSKMDKKELLYSYWNNWLDMKENVEEAYKRNDPEVASMMEKAIENYADMIELFSYVNPNGDRIIPVEPLNGEERLEFIREKLMKYHAYVQLDALYTEVLKKAVSRLAMKK